jgi:DNA polymerase-3 subunit alpha
MTKNYTLIHLHSDYSVLDSATKFSWYVDKAKELGMSALAITEHGNFFNWVKKKQYCDKSGIKYIHGQEFYVTETIENKVRDNYHCLLYARNWDGVKELNELSSRAYQKDGHFYYDPRITIDELTSTSNNVIVSTSCLGGILNSDNDSVKSKFLEFIESNKNRCFLEIQHHNDSLGEQAKYNRYLHDLSNRFGMTLWVGTDTHSLNKELADLRIILQKSKNINFANEGEWDLTLKTYDQLVAAYEIQNSLPRVVYLDAIENTNMMIDMVEDFSFDLSYKYPKVYENPELVFREKVYEGLKNKGLENNSEYVDRVEYEIHAIAKNGAIDYLLLQEKITSWCKSNGIFPGPSRGSVSGCLCAYLLGITEVDSIRFGMNFERFMNAERVSLSDIDIDYPPNKREEVKNYIFNELGLNCCDIVAFNTVATKGAVRDVARAMSVPLKEVDEICDNVESNREKYEKLYPQIFKYSNLLEGVITSAGVHPCGVITSARNIREELGIFTTSTDTHPISQVDMKDVDSLNFVKLDVLGLDNIQTINETCELAGIERITPDNADFEDLDVWNDISNNSLGVFQWESSFAHQVYKRLFSSDTIKKIESRTGKVDRLSLISMGNGALRPAGESYRDKMCEGKFNDNGHDALNELLKPTLGYLVYQEQIIEFLNKFCGFSMGKADLVRRGFAKKSGTEKFIPEIKSGFISTMKEKYSVEEKESEKIIESFLKVIEDASAYLFSSNHSYPYSMIGYICAYLRHHYKIEFLTSMLNINRGNIDKSSEITEYATSCGIKVEAPKFGKSRSTYFFDKDSNTIYKDASSVKFVNKEVAEELFSMKDIEFESFVDFLVYVEENCKINSRQMETLIKINYFSNFSLNKKLILFYKEFSSGKLRYSKTHSEKTKTKRIEELKLFWESLPDERLGVWEQIVAEQEVLGYIQATYPHIDKRYVYVMEINEKYSPRIELYCMANGKRRSIKIQKKLYENNIFYGGDILYVKSFREKPAVKFVDGKYVESPDEKQWWIENFTVLTPEQFDSTLKNLEK